jgi:putative hemolysin
MDIFLIVILIVFNGLLAMTEMAVISFKKARLQQRVETGSLGAAKAIFLQEKPALFLSTVQVGITSVGILNGIVGEKTLMEPMISFLNSIGLTAYSKPIGSVLVIVLLTYLSVVFGEIIPKRLGMMMAEKMASTMAVPMDLLSKFTYPLVWIFTVSCDALLKLFKLDNIQQSQVSNEEVKELMSQGAEAGIFHESEKKLVANILHMDEKKAASIMTHRSDLFFIDAADPYEENLQKIIHGKYSKIAVVKESVDQIIGFIRMTDLMPQISAGEKIDFEKSAQKTTYLPNSVTATQILENFKREQTEIAIIVNEYGENVGIVTLHDILGAIVGDINVGETEDEIEIKKRDDGTYLVDGLTTLDKVSSYFNLSKFELDENVHTISGLIMVLSGKIPSKGDKVEFKNKNSLLKIEVVDTDNNRVDQVILQIEEEEDMLHLAEDNDENKNT